MDFIRKHLSEILLGLLISAFYLTLRLIFLDKLPIFTDEAIYTRWAQIALNDSAWRFIPLTDGKQPMFVWLVILFMKFIKDPLIAARLVSVASGFFTLVGLWFLTNELFKNKKIAYLSSLLYVFYPFAVVYDRMALYDSMVGTFYVWALYFSVLLVRKLRLDIAYTLGFVIGAGILTKTSNFFSIYLLPFLLILFNFEKKTLLPRLARFILFSLFSAAIAYGLYNVLRLSPLFQMISAKNAVFVYPISEWINHPFTFFIGNLHGQLSWLTEYLTLPYLLLLLISLAFFKNFFKEKLLLLVYFALPFMALALFGKVIFPRFIFFMSLMLLPICALGLNYVFDFLFKKQALLKLKISKIQLAILISLLFIIYPAFVSFQFAYDPINSKIAKADNSQYVNSWAGGWGVTESVAFFRQKAKDQKIFIATEGTFGLMPAGLELYLVSNKNVTIKGYWPVDEIPSDVLRFASRMPSYFIFYQKNHLVIPPSFPLKLLFQVRQGNSDSFYRVYQIIPPQNK